MWWVRWISFIRILVHLSLFMDLHIQACRCYNSYAYVLAFFCFVVVRMCLVCICVVLCKTCRRFWINKCLKRERKKKVVSRGTVIRLHQNQTPALSQSGRKEVKYSDLRSLCRKRRLLRKLAELPRQQVTSLFSCMIFIISHMATEKNRTRSHIIYTNFFIWRETRD